MCRRVTERPVCRSVQSLSLAVVYLENKHTILISVNGGNVSEDGSSDYLKTVMPKQNAADVRVTENTCTG